MNDMLLPKYSFSDITVYMRTKDGKYLNLTDFDIASQENEKTAYKSDSKYIIVFCSFFCNAYKKRGIKPHVCDVTLSDLFELADMHDKNFFKRFQDVENSEEFLAVVCAKKIINYRWGKIEKNATVEKEYCFYRNGKCERTKKLVLKKLFYEA